MRGSSKDFKPLAGVFLAILFWGVSFVVTKLAVASFDPFTLIFARSALGTALLCALLAARREAVLPPRDAWPALAAMGFVGVAFHQVLQAWALTLTTAVNTGWLIGLTPIWTALLAAWRLRERLGGTKLLGLALGLGGTILIVTRGQFGPGTLALPTARGDLLILASTLNWSIYTVMGHATLRRLGPTRATAGAMAAGCLMLAPTFVFQQGWA